MSGRILVFDESREAGKHLSETLRQGIGTYLGAVNYDVHNSDEVFTQPLQETAEAAFFHLSNMYDAEAARKFSAFHKDIPLVAVSDNDQYCLMSWDLGACYYLTPPIHMESLIKAIKKCTRIRLKT